MSVSPAPGNDDLRDRSMGELLKQLSQETSTLVKQELDLAKAEMAEKGKHAGKGIGLFSGAGLFGLGAFLALTAAIIAALSTAMDVWIAALIVAVVYGIVAAVLAKSGQKEIKEATPVAPEQTVETLKEDAEWAKTRTRSDAR
jgi:uncharacterized membrane protein YqjE